MPAFSLKPWTWLPPDDPESLFPYTDLDSVIVNSKQLDETFVSGWRVGEAGRTFNEGK